MSNQDGDSRGRKHKEKPDPRSLPKTKDDPQGIPTFNLSNLDFQQYPATHSGYVSHGNPNTIRPPTGTLTPPFQFNQSYQANRPPPPIPSSAVGNEPMTTSHSPVQSSNENRRMMQRPGHLPSSRRRTIPQQPSEPSPQQFSKVPEQRERLSNEGVRVNAIESEEKPRPARTLQEHSTPLFRHGVVNGGILIDMAVYLSRSIGRDWPIYQWLKKHYIVPLNQISRDHGFIVEKKRYMIELIRAHARYHEIRPMPYGISLQRLWLSGFEPAYTTAKRPKEYPDDIGISREVLDGRSGVSDLEVASEGELGKYVQRGY
ncbi:hypothetical protein P280DRAFT_549713 [Massarina eburnea CBS 473.64]|uniref:Uncharacterized protein n=1 Tax=Massarina eburnea CBS 473.64 TaxID=1395130 RepID=A0A6A6S3G0_9PLEO|nr:hypothetical protein P280DRAFT_549713 [Massarina eburnea CBS 473.64]